jgi:hypothetical protein
MLDPVNDLMYGKTSRRWARNRIAGTRRLSVSGIAKP